MPSLLHEGYKSIYLKHNSEEKNTKLYINLQFLSAPALRCIIWIPKYNSQT